MGAVKFDFQIIAVIFKSNSVSDFLPPTTLQYLKLMNPIRSIHSFCMCVLSRCVEPINCLKSKTKKKVKYPPPPLHPVRHREPRTPASGTSNKDFDAFI